MTEAFPTLSAWTEPLSKGAVPSEAVTKAPATSVTFGGFLVRVSFSGLTEWWFPHEAFTHTQVIFPVDVLSSTLILRLTQVGVHTRILCSQHQKLLIFKANGVISFTIHYMVPIFRNLNRIAL